MTSPLEKAVTPAWAKTVGSFRFDEIAEEDGDKVPWSAGACSSFPGADLSAPNGGTGDCRNPTSSTGAGMAPMCHGDKSPREGSNESEQSASAPA